MLVCARDSIPVSQKKWKQHILYISISRELIFLLPDNAFFLNLKFQENARKTGFVKDTFFISFETTIPGIVRSLMVLNNFFVIIEMSIFDSSMQRPIKSNCMKQDNGK